LRLSAPQHVFLNELKTKYRAYVAGFGGGKTYVGCLDLLLFAAKHPKTVQGYFAPSYRDIKDTFWPTIEEAGEPLGFRCDIKRADKEVHLYRGSKYFGAIVCRSMDDPGSIVGFKIARASVDELDTMPTDKAQHAWRKIIARMRLIIPGEQNGIGVTTTPEGYKFVYEQFARAPTESYSMVQASSYENAEYLPPDYIDSLLETYPSELVSAYVNGEFVNLKSGAVYRQYSREKNRSNETIREKEPLHIGMDFNIQHMAASIFVQRPDGWHAIAELYDVLDTPTMAQMIKGRYPDHPIYVYPDASGQNASSKGASQSDVSILTQAGFTVRAKKANPAVKDRYMSVNKAFEVGKLWVNDKAAPRIAECLEKQAFDANGEPEKPKQNGFDHQNDATGYFVYWHMPVVKPVIVTNIGFVN
jgi:hypothetical protein